VNKEKPKRTWKVTIEYVPLPGDMRDWVYGETVRVFLSGENERKKSEGPKEEQIPNSENMKGGINE
jgi:hypothetical protein